MPDELDDLINPPPAKAAATIAQGVALGTDPVAEGKLLDRSAATGIPVQQVREMPAVELDDLIQKDSRIRAYQRSAVLSRWVADNPHLGDISRGDELALERAQQATAEWYAALEANRVTTSEKAAALVQVAGKGVAAGLSGLGRMAYGTLQAISDDLAGENSASSQLYADLAASATGAPERLKAQLHGQTVESVMEDDARNAILNPAKVFARQGGFFNTETGRFEVGIGDLTSGATSLLPTITAAALSGGSTLAVSLAAGAQTFGSVYADLRERGMAADSAGGRALLTGAITGTLTRFFGPNVERTLAGMFAGTVPKAVASRAAFVKVLGKQIAAEMGEEGLDQFAQTLITGGTLHDAVTEGVKAGMIGGVLGGAVGLRAAHLEAKVEGTLAYHDKLDGLVKAIDSTQLKTRSVEATKSFMQAVNPKFATAPAVFDAAELAPLLDDQQVVEDLLKIGLTKEAILDAERTGSTISSTLSKVLIELPAATRDKLRPLLRESADAMSPVEAKAAKEGAKDATPEQKTAVAAEAKKIRKEFAAERSRILKEMKTASKAALTPEDAKKIRSVLDQFAASMERNTAGAKSSLDTLRKVTFAPDEKLTPAEVRQRITDLAGPDGKTALGRIDLVESLGKAAARFDILTGRTAISPSALTDQRQVDAILADTGKEALDLAGRTLVVNGQQVAAAEEVATLRQKLDNAVRLVECVG
jgi:hypothetical protein